METLTEVLEEQVKDLYSAENQLLKALPKMAKKATTQELKDAFLSHAQETQVHVDRLVQVAESLGIKPTGKVCAAMKGLVEEGKEVLEEDGKNEAIDAALIAAAQRVEHYEMAAYGCVKTLATVLDKSELVELFEATLAEEKAADEKLTMVAEENVYPNAQKDDSEEEEDGEEEEESAAKSPKGRSSGGRSGGGSGNRTPPSREAASRGGKASAGKSKSRR